LEACCVEPGAAPAPTGPGPTPTDPCAGNTAPIITDIPDDKVICTDYWEYDVIVTDDGVNGTTLIYSLSGAPGNMVIDSSGKITFTSVCGDVGGPYTVTVQVEDVCKAIDTEGFKITVTNDIPVIDPIKDQTVVCKDHWEYQVKVKDIDVPTYQSLKYSLSGAPGNMAINSSGKITFDPGCNDVGTHTVTVLVEDTCCGADKIGFKITVTNDIPVITSSAPTTVIVGETYVYDIIVTDADVPNPQFLTFSITNPDPLLGDMAITPTGDHTAQMTWNPTCDDYINLGEVEVTIEVSDNCCGTDTQTFTIEILSCNHKPWITSFPCKLWVCNGGTWYYNANAFDLDGDKLTWTLSTNAAGMTIDPDTGVINWTANCDTKTKDLCPPVECERLVCIEVCDDGCPIMCDEQCFYVKVLDCTVW
jgi:hypothetical protein